jgi:uncharacterized protein
MHALTHILALTLTAGLAHSTLADGCAAHKPACESQVAQATVDFKPGRNDLTFTSDASRIAAHLYLPPTYRPGDRLPVVVVAGSWTSVKEQMAGLYGAELAKRGIAALAFDFRHWGESEGEPRCFENPAAKIADLRAASAFLATLPLTQSVGAVGICASAGYVAHAAAADKSIASVALVASWLHDAKIVDAVYGADRAKALIARAAEAKAEFEKTGQARFVPAQSETDKDAAMPMPAIYYGNPARGSIPQWDNRFAVMSWGPWLTFDAHAAAPSLTQPLLMVHGDSMALPDAARAFFAKVPGDRKDLVWTAGGQLDMYDQPALVSKAADFVADHMRRTLGTTTRTKAE